MFKCSFLEFLKTTRTVAASILWTLQQVLVALIIPPVRTGPGEIPLERGTQPSAFVLCKDAHAYIWPQLQNHGLVKFPFSLCFGVSWGMITQKMNPVLKEL